MCGKFVIQTEWGRNSFRVYWNLISAKPILCALMLRNETNRMQEIVSTAFCGWGMEFFEDN